MSSWTAAIPAWVARVAVRVRRNLFTGPAFASLPGLACLLLLGAACGAPETATATPPPTPADLSSTPPAPEPGATGTEASAGAGNADGVWQPGPGVSWQWQLTEDIDPSFDVEMYDIDLFDVPQEVIDRLHADGRIVICYFSAGSWEDWRDDAQGFPDAIKGKDNGWPGELWLDIRDLETLAPLMQARLDLAADKGCDGVEPDNVGAYQSDSGFPISYDNQLAYNRWLAEEAHRRGLSIGLKNDLAQIDDLVGHFDWALNEECFQYRECEPLSAFVAAGKAVFGVEYTGDPDDFCPEANAMNFDWLKKGLDLDAPRTACR